MGLSISFGMQTVLSSSTLVLRQVLKSQATDRRLQATACRISNMQLCRAHGNRALFIKREGVKPYPVLYRYFQGGRKRGLVLHSLARVASVLSNHFSPRLFPALQPRFMSHNLCSLPFSQIPRFSDLELETRNTRRTKDSPSQPPLVRDNERFACFFLLPNKKQWSRTEKRPRLAA